MIAQQIGIVLCRVGAAVLTVQAIRSFGYVLPALLFNDGEFWPELMTFSLVGAVPGFAAVGLWIFAERISNVSDKSKVIESSAPLNGSELIRIGTTLIGICFLVMGITTAAGIEARSLLAPDLGSEFQSRIDAQVASTMASRVSYTVEILLGLALVLGRDRLSTMLVRVKHAGVRSR